MSKTPIDVLFLSHRYDVTSGGEKALLDMISYLVKQNLRIHVIIGDSGNITSYLDEMGATYSVVYLPFWAHSGDDPTPFEFTSLNPTVNTTLQVVKIINNLQPRLCVTNTIVMPWLAYASAITRVPHAWMIHEVDAAFNFRYAIGKEQTYKTIDLLSDKIFYNSRFTAGDYSPHFLLNKEINVIYPIGEIQKPRSIKSPFRKSAAKLVCIGHIKAQKAQLDAVRAIKILKDEGKDVQLALVGGTEDKEYHQEILRYIKKYNLANDVLFIGQVKNPASYIALSDMLVSCATNESFGRVIVEAMTLGVPVIGARSAGTTEIINSNKLGLLYTPDDAKGLADCIKFLISKPKVAQNMSRDAREAALSTYSKNMCYDTFMQYVKSSPERHSLDLSVLASVTTDFDDSVALLRAREQEIEALKSGYLYRFTKKIRRR